MLNIYIYITHTYIYIYVYTTPYTIARVMNIDEPLVVNDLCEHGWWLDNVHSQLCMPDLTVPAV